MVSKEFLRHFLSFFLTDQAINLKNPFWCYIFYRKPITKTSSCVLLRSRDICDVTKPRYIIPLKSRGSDINITWSYDVRSRGNFSLRYQTLKCHIGKNYFSFKDDVIENWFTEKVMTSQGKSYTPVWIAVLIGSIFALATIVVSFMVIFRRDKIQFVKTLNFKILFLMVSRFVVASHLLMASIIWVSIRQKFLETQVQLFQLLQLMNILILKVNN